MAEFSICAYNSNRGMRTSDRARVDNPTDGLTMAKNESTGKKAALAASKVLSDPKSSKAAKTAAASALTQSKSTETTSAKSASAASKVLNDPKASKAAKTAAASALTQKKK